MTVKILPLVVDQALLTPSAKHYEGLLQHLRQSDLQLAMQQFAQKARMNRRGREEELYRLDLAQLHQSQSVKLFGSKHPIEHSMFVNHCDKDYFFLKLPVDE